MADRARPAEPEAAASGAPVPAEGAEHHVVIVGGGLAVAQELGGAAGIRVTLVDRRNHHLFQPLL